MLLKVVYVLTCRILGLIVVLFRGDQAAVAEVLVLRHENAVLRRHAGRVRYEPADWPSLRDARAALVTGGLRVRGWTWSLSMLWVVAGIVGTGYDFYITTKPYTWATADVGIGIAGWSTDPVAVQIAVVLATAASLALPIPALIAGFIRLRSWRPRSWLRIAAWAGAWIAGFALIYQAGVWGNYPANCPAIADNCPAIGSPAVVSWGELGICAAWLVPPTGRRSRRFL